MLLSRGCYHFASEGNDPHKTGTCSQSLHSSSTYCSEIDRMVDFATMSAQRNSMRSLFDDDDNNEHMDSVHDRVFFQSSRRLDGPKNDFCFTDYSVHVQLYERISAFVGPCFQVQCNPYGEMNFRFGNVSFRAIAKPSEDIITIRATGSSPFLPLVDDMRLKTIQSLENLSFDGSRFTLRTSINTSSLGDSSFNERLVCFLMKALSISREY